MKDRTIINNFNKQAKVMQEIEGQLNQRTQMLISYIGQLNHDMRALRTYLSAIDKYNKHFFWLPRNFRPGSVIFDKIYNKEIEAVNKAVEEQRQKQQQEAAKMRTQIMEERKQKEAENAKQKNTKENGNKGKKVSVAGEGRKDK